MNDLNLAPLAAEYVTTTISNHVLTIMMNKPKKLNGWTQEMMEGFKAALAKANTDESVKAVIFTGAGEYYSAGVNLGGTLKPMHPKKLKITIAQLNQELFEVFLDCTKPLLIAVNGPAIGASVTSATLANGIIASKNATFSTPFKALGITPEGCSSIHFARLMGEQNAQRMLGAEGWKPTADEALSAGLIQWVAPQDALQEEAMKIATSWVEQGVTREFLAGSQLEELREVNAKESLNLADAFLGPDFLREQGKFLWSKNKKVPSAVFFSLWALRPIWGKLV